MRRDCGGPWSMLSMEDSAWKTARREAIVIAVVAVLATVYSVGYCYAFGYDRAGEPIRFVLGFPAWVFWGIVVPWLGCVGFAAWFSLAFMSDEPLGDDTNTHEDQRDA
jgi:hypothetical protein